jgi:CubicO group peptidase (beta-lactamase class C family)
MTTDSIVSPSSELESALSPIFLENFSRRGEVGASVSVWQHGTEIVRLAAGLKDRNGTAPWDADTMALVYSATKGPAAACVLRAMWEAGLGLDEPVGAVWPEFAQAGKERVTLGEALSHRAGLAALDDPPDVFDYPAVIRALERQMPLWQPGDGHGYHPRTSGFLWDEIVRRLTGRPLAQYWREEIAAPLGLDFWIGVPEARVAEVATIHPSRTPPREDAFLAAFGQPGSLTHRAFGSPRGLASVSAMNTKQARMASFPAFGGIGTASSLARFYDALANGTSGIAPGAVQAMSRRLTNGHDLVLQMENAFSAGFLQDPTTPEGDKARATFGPSLRSFGQPGAGGSVGFADPDRGLGFAYVMNQMEPGVLPNSKSLLLIQRMYEVLGRAPT